MAKRQPLDQARDLRTTYFASMAEAYDGYLEGEYEANFNEEQPGWKTHFENMRHAFAECLLCGIESGNMPARQDMNLAIVGPGFHPVGRDFDEPRIKDYLSRLNAVVIIDFSRKVIKSAVDALIKAGVPWDKVYPMEFDITRGLSTAYDKWIKEMLNVSTEEELSRATEGMANLNIEALDAIAAREIEEGKPLVPEDEYLEGGINIEGKIKLSISGEALPLDMVSLQMITSGTGVSAEARFWDTYHEVVSRSSEEVTDAVEEERYKMFERVHRMIARYNTEVTSECVAGIIASNPNAIVLSVADVATVWEKPRYGEMPRLNMSELTAKLDRTSNVKTFPMFGWDWYDEPEHRHPVRAFEFRQMKKRNGNGHTNKIDNSGQS